MQNLGVPILQDVSTIMHILEPRSGIHVWDACSVDSQILQFNRHNVRFMDTFRLEMTQSYKDY